MIARIEAKHSGMDIRTIVTSIRGATPERLYELDYCDRGQAENLIKLHKTQLKSDRTSCMSAAANQMRLILCAPAGFYWLLWTVREAIPETAKLKRAEFTALQTRLVKIGARIIETATRIRIAFLCLPGQGPDRPARPVACNSQEIKNHRLPDRSVAKPWKRERIALA